jgi:hypothetical protein
VDDCDTATRDWRVCAALGILRPVRFAAFAVVRAALLLTACTATTCRSHPQAAGEVARSFYEAAAQGDMRTARSALIAGTRLRSLERRFGALESWATRATKNNTVTRIELLDEAEEGWRAHVRLVVVFNDGTRRHDRVELVRVGDRWLLDPASLPGARRSSGDRRGFRRRMAAVARPERTG